MEYIIIGAVVVFCFGMIFSAHLIKEGLESIELTVVVRNSEVKTVSVDTANSVSSAGLIIEGENHQVMNSTFTAPKIEVSNPLN